MSKYRKKPVVIEAMQYANGEDCIALHEWMGQDTPAGHYMCGGGAAIHIHTLEGDMEAKLGDWIIKGVKGEFYPCKPDIFEATYDPVQEAEE